jgi:hypothetical protein
MSARSSDLGADRVLEALAAAQFAAAIFLPLDVLVTVNFSAMGVDDADEARRELQRFVKAMGAWLNERCLPVIWIATIERGAGGILHAHVAVHLPGVMKDGSLIIGPRHRTHFRNWARRTMARRTGAKIPRLINVRCGLVATEIAHWMCVTYLLKGFDKTAVLPCGHGSGHRVMVPLADIMPFPYRSAGDVAGRRLFISGNLGPARRKIGMPAGFEFMLPMKPDISVLEVMPGANAAVPKRSRGWIPRPFVAAVEDGRFDVRDIYGEKFAQFVTKAPSRGGTADPMVITIDQLMSHLDDLGI